MDTMDTTKETDITGIQEATNMTRATETIETQGTVASVAVKQTDRIDAFMLWWLGSPDTKVTLPFLLRLVAVGFVVVLLVGGILSSVAFLVFYTISAALAQFTL